MELLMPLKHVLALSPAISIMKPLMHLKHELALSPAISIMKPLMHLNMSSARFMHHATVILLIKITTGIKLLVNVFILKGGGRERRKINKMIAFISFYHR